MTPNSRLYLLVSMLLLLGVSAHAQKYSSKRVTEEPRPFRYVFVGNQIDEDDDPTLRRRVVGVLMERKAFSEKNLRTLFSLVAKRFPEPQTLYIDVATSLDDVMTPEERDKCCTSHLNDSPSTQKRVMWAGYVRTDEVEWFSYSPLKDLTDNILVEIKPLPNKPTARRQ